MEKCNRKSAVSNGFILTGSALRHFPLCERRCALISMSGGAGKNGLRLDIRRVWPYTYNHRLPQGAKGGSPATHKKSGFMNREFNFAPAQDIEPQNKDRRTMTGDL